MDSGRFVYWKYAGRRFLARTDVGCGTGADPMSVRLSARLDFQPVGADLAIFSFLSSWGDRLFGLTIVTEDSMRPVTAGLWKFMGSNASPWNLVMALATLEMLPPLVLFLLAQRRVVAGMTAGSVK